jgi:hypothetical protein
MELTEDQQKGLDMMVIILSRVYPFITGAVGNVNDFETYSTLFTVKLMVNKSKLEKCFKQKLDTNWKEFWRLGNVYYPNPDPDNLIVEEIQRLGTMFYRSIGDEYQFDSGSILMDKYREVKINSFIFDDEN